MELFPQQNSTSLLVVGVGSEGAAVGADAADCSTIPFALGRPMPSLEVPKLLFWGTLDYVAEKAPFYVKKGLVGLKRSFR